VAHLMILVAGHPTDPPCAVTRYARRASSSTIEKHDFTN